jgi:hypothetical protein
MAAVAGPRIAEIKVRHHARRFGESKYGLSRVYKVLLDLLTIKTIAGFTSRPLTWFTLLSIPAIFLAAVLLVSSVVVKFTGEATSLPMAGSGLFFVSLGFFLVFSGVLAELVYKTGDPHIAKLPLITATEIRVADDRRTESEEVRMTLE